MLGMRPWMDCSKNLAWISFLTPETTNHKDQQKPVLCLKQSSAFSTLAEIVVAECELVVKRENEDEC